MLYYILLTLVFINSNCFRIDLSDILPKEYSITSSKINSTIQKRSIGCIILYIYYESRKLKLCIHKGNFDERYAPSDTPVHLIDTDKEHILRLDELKLSPVDGYVVGYKNDSSIDGYIEDDKFYGRFEFGNTIYYVDKLEDFPEIVKKNNIKDYQDKSLIYKISGRLNQFKSNHLNDVFRNKRSYEGNICTVSVFIDWNFWQMIGKTQDAALTTVLISLKRVDSIFRSTDFDGDDIPDNIGLVIYRIYIESDKIMTPPYSRYPVDGRYLLIRMSLFRPFALSCLGIVFTPQPLIDDVIGLSYTAGIGKVPAGICIVTNKQCANLVVLTYFHSSGKRLPQIVCDLSTAHEIGHSFGSIHDGNDKYCEGYLMAPKAVEKPVAKSFRFSPCSKVLINRIIKQRNVCLLEDPKSFCGNGLLEEEEQCDCGSYFHCLYNDHCCLPYYHKDGCKVNIDGGFQCHPMEGLCCSEKCFLKNLKPFGIDCSMFRKKCTNSTETDVDCGVNSSCLDLVCHNKECVRIGLEECSCPKNDPKSTSCQTCCLLNGTCLTAPIATKQQIKEVPILLTNLSESNVIKPSSKYDIPIKFCHLEECIQVYFKIFEVGKYCILNGLVGSCKKSGCVLPKPDEVTDHKDTTNKNGSEEDKRQRLFFMVVTFSSLFLRIKLLMNE